MGFLYLALLLNFCIMKKQKDTTVRKPLFVDAVAWAKNLAPTKHFTIASRTFNEDSVLIEIQSDKNNFMHTPYTYTLLIERIGRTAYAYISYQCPICGEWELVSDKMSCLLVAGERTLGSRACGSSGVCAKCRKIRTIEIKKVKANAGYILNISDESSETFWTSKKEALSYINDIVMMSEMRFAWYLVQVDSRTNPTYRKLVAYGVSKC